MLEPLDGGSYPIAFVELFVRGFDHLLSTPPCLMGDQTPASGRERCETSTVELNFGCACLDD